MSFYLNVNWGKAHFLRIALSTNTKKIGKWIGHNKNMLQ